MDKLALARRATLAGWLGLVLLIPAWYGWFAPPPGLLAPLAVGLLLLPLLLAAPGLLRGLPYTHAWVSMIALLYFTHAIAELFANPLGRRFALLELLLATSLYFGAMLYARWRARQLKSWQDSPQ